jgi:CDP-diacylglycerol--glycerol-3-phosphate 3-phosphatidyltransferase
VIGLAAAGLTGLGVPYALAVGLWVLAALSAVTFGQRVLAVRTATQPARDGDPSGEGARPREPGPSTGGTG